MSRGFEGPSMAVSRNRSDSFSDELRRSGYQGEADRVANLSDKRISRKSEQSWNDRVLILEVFSGPGFIGFEFYLGPDTELKLLYTVTVQSPFLKPGPRACGSCMLARPFRQYSYHMMKYQEKLERNYDNLQMQVRSSEEFWKSIAVNHWLIGSKKTENNCLGKTTGN